MSGPVCSSPALVRHTHTHTHTHSRNGCTHACTTHIKDTLPRALPVYKTASLSLSHTHTRAHILHLNHMMLIYREVYLSLCDPVTATPGSLPLSPSLSLSSNTWRDTLWWGVSVEEWFSAALPQPLLRHLPQESRCTHTHTHIFRRMHTCMHLYVCSWSTYIHRDVQLRHNLLIHSRSLLPEETPFRRFRRAAHTISQRIVNLEVMNSWIFSRHLILSRGSWDWTLSQRALGSMEGNTPEGSPNDHILTRIQPKQGTCIISHYRLNRPRAEAKANPRSLRNR